MKDKLKVFLAKLKAFFVHIWLKLKEKWKQVLIVLLLIFLCSCSWFSACQRSSEKSTLSAGADEISSINDESYINPSLYAYNIYPAVYPRLLQDERFTVDLDGTIHINGTFDTADSFNMPTVDLEDNTSYYFNGRYGSTSVYVYADIRKEEGRETISNGVFNSLTMINPARFILYVPAGTYNNFILRIVLARSEVAVEWTPSLSLLQDKFTNDGYNAGYTAGYESGYNDGINVYKYGVFYNANVKTTLDNGINQVDFTLPFDYTNGTFTNVYDEIQNNYSSILGSLQTISLSILPDVSISPNNLDFTLNTFYPENYKDFTLKYMRVSISAGMTNLSSESVNVDFQPVPNIRETFTWSSDILINEYYDNGFDRLYGTFTSFDFSISNVDFLRGFSLKSSYNAYNKAYDEGYNKGYDEGYNISQISFENQLKAQYDFGRSDGYTVGFNEGYSKGKIEGYNEGRDVTEQGFTFVSLIDAVGYGITKPFASLLNFNLLGVNLLAFMSGLLTLVLMIKLVSFFI